MAEIETAESCSSRSVDSYRSKCSIDQSPVRLTLLEAMGIYQYTIPSFCANYDIAVAKAAPSSV